MPTRFQDDLSVTPISDALSGVHIDLAITGSIASTESVKFIRSLRRLGAEVYPWLSKGGEQFVTPTSLEWASHHKAVTQFSGLTSHLAQRDACVVAPASSNFISKLVNGITDSPSLALAASYLGQGLPVLVLPNMHESLYASPAIKENIAKLPSMGVTMLETRNEEGKRKFPLPELLADDVAQQLNKNNSKLECLLVAGSTKGYIDDVRYISNYSSGALGKTLGEELFRQGYATHIVQGSATYEPRRYTSIQHCETNDAMEKAAIDHCDRGMDVVVMMASVLDFIPESRQQGKIRSSTEFSHVPLKKTDKILPKLVSRKGIKVGFKLEPEYTAERGLELADHYFAKNNLSLFVINSLKDVSDKQHTAYIYSRHPKTGDFQATEATSKRAISLAIIEHIKNTAKTNKESY